MAEPSRPRRLLANELLRLRELAGLSGREIARRTGVSQPVVSRIDRGLALPAMPVVVRWLTECGADDDTQVRVLALAEWAHGETRPWKDLIEGRAHLQDDARDRNDASRVVRNFQPTIIPGLLQTAEYARAILSLGRTDVAQAVAARISRQEVLHQPGRRFQFLIGEHALSWSPGRRALAGQLDRIVSLVTLESVDVAILRGDTAPVIPWHNFVLREPADGSPVYVTTELFHGAQEILAADSVAIYTDAWDRLWKDAVHGDEAVELLRRLA